MRLAILFLFLFSLSNSYLSAQNMDCKKFRTGKYFLPNEEGKEYLIHRKKKIQTEQLEGDGTVVKFKVEWVNECTYTLRFVKFIKNPKNHKDYPKNFVVTVEILEVYEDAYLQRSYIEGLGVPPEEAVMTKVTK